MDRASLIRQFNRFYTRRFRLLQEGLLDSPLSLTEARVLFELAQGEAAASALASALEIDPGYLSRILDSFVRKGYARRQASKEDRRQRRITLTKAGQKLFASLDAKSQQQAQALLAPLAEADQAKLIGAMRDIASILGGSTPTEPYLLRTHRPGDVGWIVHRHGVLYVEREGWEASFEALVARIGARFIEKFDPARERCWMAERAGRIIGSVTLVKKSERVAQLRMLYVEPEARGLGVGRRLVEECILFSRKAGYRKIVLWTNRTLLPARRIYEAQGFQKIASDGDYETWELGL
jgi:DNA-binding MarR family transcriptional regulator/GNAT superfamily N-acetyltransferase